MPERHASAARTQPAPGDPSDPRVSVLIPLPLAGAYDYLGPDDPPLVPGEVVRVPLGWREVLGVVWDRETEPETDPGAESGAEAVPAARLKWVRARCDVPPFTEVQRRFIDWVAGYTLAAPGAVLRMALSVPKALEPPRPVTGYRLANGAAEARAEIKPTPARGKVITVLEDGPARPLAELARAAGVGVSVVKGLAKAGVLETVELPPPAAFEAPRPDRGGPTLSPDQDAAAAALRATLEAPPEGQGEGSGFDVAVLDGVTGSGKTEVYLEAVAAALESGRQVLVLLPEIALSAQWLERFALRFGAAPAVWHSELTGRERRATWRAVAFGEARVVVGARSALFLPFAELGLIVVDEEHDAAFKQEDGVIYHARDMAVVRARLGAIPIVLVSATPSLETVTNVTAGRYRRLHLPDRHGGAKLPEVTLVDLRRDKPARIEGLGQSWLSPSLRQAIGETLAAGEQVLLFLNRRGYAPLTLCRACGHRMACPHCTAWLVEHRRAGSLPGRLRCHHCGFETRLPEHCPACQAEDALAACGPGVERLAEEVAALYPQARVAVMASDTLGGPSAAAALLRSVAAREVDLLIGTQVVAKGHHFPHLTLVGVVDADLGLYGGDLRAAERTYQLLHQVAGRAGREARPGRVLIQTAEPEHPVMQALASSGASGGRDRFIEVETEARQHAGMPPFGRLVALILSSPDLAALERTARALARVAPHYDGVQVLGPAPAPLAVLRGRHRCRFLLKARRQVAVQKLVRDWVGQVKLPAKLRLQIDIDPYSFM